MFTKWVSQVHILKCVEVRTSKRYQQNKPFPHIILKNFLLPNQASKICKALTNLSFMRKDSDLFCLEQSYDFKHAKGILKDLHGLFSSQEFVSYIESISKMKLKHGNIDMAAQRYRDKCYLLPHDDRLESRKVAYILNFTKNFEKKDGGQLQFFDSKGSHPKRVVKSYIPEFNTLYLFTVSKNSWHQVSEVTSNKSRISIAGWFHG